MACQKSPVFLMDVTDCSVEDPMQIGAREGHEVGVVSQAPGASLSAFAEERREEDEVEG